jgi:hypothetical protein
MMKFNRIVFLFLTLPVWANVPISDNVLFAFEKCRGLSVDLEKGRLVEAPLPPFDLHCRKLEKLELSCEEFDQGAAKPRHREIFEGGSDLGEGLLKSKSGKKIRFLIGKKFAAFESPSDFKVCAGIHLFEKEALKAKAP